jgi:hypothetical protein
LEGSKINKKCNSIYYPKVTIVQTNQTAITIVPLKKITYDVRARSGFWCRLPYPGHKKGCPKFPQCPGQHTDFLRVKDTYQWFAVIASFDLKSHADKMQAQHIGWSRRRARCVLYWQAGVVRQLKARAYSLKPDIVLECPEASGINLFVTMAKVGVNLKPNPDEVRKIILVGWRQPLNVLLLDTMILLNQKPVG